MKKTLLLIIIIVSFLSCSKENNIVEIGKRIPDYTFNEILNTDKKSFSLKNQNKPIIIEFWATWCSPCIPAMSKLEGLQKEYGDKIEVITVSAENKKNLNRYIENTNTTLRIAFDTVHLKTFNYKHIPHTILIDKNGITQAITTPNKVTKQIVADLINGKVIKIQEDNKDFVSDTSLNVEFKNNDFQYKLTSENKNFSYKNEIKKDANNKPVSLDFKNVSIYRLMTDIYELSSSARVYNPKEITTKNKYCFNLEQSDSYKKDLLQNAKDILNSNLDIKAEIIEIEMDSIYVLEIIDKTKLPIKSTEKESTYEFRGPYYLGKKITSYNLIEYLENEVYKPVKNKTKIDYKFDIELNWNYESTKSLNQELRKYGLQISKSKKTEKIKLLELSKKKR